MKTLRVCCTLAICAVAVQGCSPQADVTAPRNACILAGDTAAGKADVAGGKRLTEGALRAISDKVYGDCMGTPGAYSGNRLADDPELEPNRYGRFITRANACGKTLDTRMDESGRTVAFVACMAESAK
jgi:hypothetical protein